MAIELIFDLHANGRNRIETQNYTIYRVTAGDRRDATEVERDADRMYPG